MNRNELIEKVDSLRVGENSSFCVVNDGDTYEFKLIEVNGEEYKVFGGFGFNLQSYNQHWHSDDIVNEFEELLKKTRKELSHTEFI